MVYPPADGHPSSTDWAWHTVTSFIETNVLPLSQIATCNYPTVLVHKCKCKCKCESI